MENLLSQHKNVVQWQYRNNQAWIDLPGKSVHWYYQRGYEIRGLGVVATMYNPNPDKPAWPFPKDQPGFQ